MTIRLAMPNDVEQLCRLYNEFFAHNADLAPDYFRAGTESGSYPKSTIDSESADIFVATEDNTIVGFLHIREAQTPPYDAFIPRKYAVIIDFFVTAPYRKQGIGTMLMDSAKQWAAARKLDYIELSVSSSPKGAYEFYRQKDFAAVSYTMRYPLITLTGGSDEN